MTQHPWNLTFIKMGAKSVTFTMRVIFMVTHTERKQKNLETTLKVLTPPGTTSSSITTHTPSGQRNCASWASQPQKSVTLLPCPGGRTAKSTKDMWWHWPKKKTEGADSCPQNDGWCESVYTARTVESTRIYPSKGIYRGFHYYPLAISALHGSFRL